MVSEKMVAWGSQGCVIRDLAAYGEQRAAVVGAENVFNFTIGNPSVPAPSCVRQTIEHLLQTVPAEQLHAYTAAPGLASVRAKMAAYLEKTFGVGYRAEDVYMTSGASSALAMLAYALLSPGDEVLTLSPYFSEYKLYAEAAGGFAHAGRAEEALGGGVVAGKAEDFPAAFFPVPHGQKAAAGGGENRLRRLVRPAFAEMLQNPAADPAEVGGHRGLDGNTPRTELFPVVLVSIQLIQFYQHIRHEKTVLS